MAVVKGIRYTNSGGDANPDGYADGTILANRLFSSVNTGNDGPYDFGGDPDLTTWTHLPTGFWNGGPCYTCTIAQNGGTVGIEQQQGSGCKWWPLSGIAADATDIMCIAFEVTLSATFISEFTTNYDDATRQSEVPPNPPDDPLGGYLYGAGKMLDIHGWNSGATSYDSTTRQIIGINPVYTTEAGIYSPTGVNVSPGLYLSAQNGGAGGAMVHDGTHTPFNFALHAGTVISVHVLLDMAPGSQQTIIYCKPYGGVLTKSVQRTAALECGNSTGPQVYGTRGWSTPADLGDYNSFIFGYWQRIRNAHSGVEFKLGNVSCANGWVRPRF